MEIVALCHDVKEGAARAALFQAHVAHNLSHMARFLFTAPIATDDGATGVGDDPRLCGSIYCVDVDALADARRIMEADPFMQGAWRQVDYYLWRDAKGAWRDAAARPKGLGPEFRCYVAAGGSEPAGALMCGPVESLATTGAAPERPFRSLAMLRAGAIEEARRNAPGAQWVVSAPVAIGRWVGIVSPADLPGAGAE